MSTQLQSLVTPMSDVTLPVLRLNGGKLSGRIEAAVTDAEIERTIDGASTLTINLHDPDGYLLRSALLTKQCWVVIDGLRYDMVQVSKSDDDLTLTFEDDSISWCRRVNGVRKANRSQLTRAQFCKLMVQDVNRARRKARPALPPLGFWSPELDTRQPLAASGVTGVKASKGANTPGTIPAFGTAKIKVKGVAATQEQQDNLALVIQVGLEHNAGTKVLWSAIMTITQESTCRNLTGGDRDSQGLFQQRTSQGWTRPRDREHAATSYYTRAIKVANDHPGYSPGQIAQAVQISQFPSAYDQWLPEAKRTLAAYQRSGQAPAGASRQPAKYQFQRGTTDGSGVTREDTWTALKRLADEVQWRVFVVKRTVWFASDGTLMRQRIAGTITQDMPDVDSIDFDWDTGKESQSASVTVRAARWAIPAGAVIQVKGCGQGDGLWLVSSVRRSLFSTSCSVELLRPRPALLEPAAEQTGTTSSGAGAGADSGDVRTAIVKTAKSMAGMFIYRQSRPIPHTAQRGAHTDCSGFATVCYEVAGAPDPNGRNFDGNGYTGTLWSHGKPVGAPQPGDLAFYGNPAAAGGKAHVVVCIGGGQCMSNGGPDGAPGPSQRPLNYRPVVGYRSYV